jgi:hypothetical protein
MIDAISLRIVTAFLCGGIVGGLIAFQFGPRVSQEKYVEMTQRHISKLANELSSCLANHAQ